MKLKNFTLCSTFPYSYVKHLCIASGTYGEGAEIVSFHGNLNSYIVNLQTFCQNLHF